MLTALATALLLHAAPGILTVELKPPKSELLVDGKKRGTGEKTLVLKLVPGKHTLRVLNKGDAHEEEIVIKSGEKKTWKWEFEGPPEEEKAP
jgi:hypothetical protein